MDKFYIIARCFNKGNSAQIKYKTETGWTSDFLKAIHFSRKPKVVSVDYVVVVTKRVEYDLKYAEKWVDRWDGV